MRKAPMTVRSLEPFQYALHAHVRGGSVSRRGHNQDDQRPVTSQAEPPLKKQPRQTPAALRERGSGGEALLSETRPLPQNLPIVNLFGREREGRGFSSEKPQTVEKRHVFKRGYGVLAYSKEIKQEKIALTIRFIFWTAAVRKDCSYMLRIPSMRA